LIQKRCHCLDEHDFEIRRRPALSLGKSRRKFLAYRWQRRRSLHFANTAIGTSPAKMQFNWWQISHH
jgi:hypothetical protein